MPLNATALTIATIAGAAAGAVAASSTPVRVDERGIGSERFGGGKRALLTVDRPDGVAATGIVGTIAVWGADLPAGLGSITGNVLGNAFASSTAPSSALLAGDGATLQFQTDIAFAAVSNNNWIVETNSFKLTGTVAVAAGVVTGTGTNFDPEIEVGDQLMLGGKLCVVTARTSDTAAVVSPAITVSAGAVGYSLAQNKFVKTYAAVPSGPQQFAVTDVGGFARIDFAVAPPSAGASASTAGANVSNIAVYKVTPVEVLAAGVHRSVRTGVRSRTVLWVANTAPGAAVTAARVGLEVSTAS